MERKYPHISTWRKANPCAEPSGRFDNSDVKEYRNRHRLPAALIFSCRCDHYRLDWHRYIFSYKKRARAAYSETQPTQFKRKVIVNTYNLQGMPND
jgi:hypothetical protein